MATNTSIRIMVSQAELFMLHESVVAMRATGLDIYKDMTAVSLLKKLTRYMLDQGYGEAITAGSTKESLSVAVSIFGESKEPVFVTERLEEKRMNELADKVKYGTATPKEEEELLELTNKLL